jgi:hypothetical protein
MHFFVVLLACKRVEPKHILYEVRFYTLIKLQKKHSILIIIFKSHQNLIYLNFSLWILFVLDYLLLQITTPYDII